MPEQLARWLQQHAAELGLASVGSSGVSLDYLGEGESYRAWLVRGLILSSGTSAPTPVVVRVARRPVAELPRPMRAEFAALQALPDGIGPRAVHLEESADVLGAPFQVQSFVPGRVLARRDWDSSLLAAHARSLAVLHTAAYDRCSELPLGAGSGSASLSLLARFDEAYAWWSSTTPRSPASRRWPGWCPRFGR